MVAWSSILLNNFPKNYQTRSLLRFSAAHKWLPIVKNCELIRSHGHGPKTINIRETEYTWASFKNLLSIYFMIGLAPTILAILYANLYVGPPSLALIPEGYEPKHWEYHRHPVSRFLARYIIRSPQEQHERNLHVKFNIKEWQLINLLRNKVDLLMDERQDYQSWYFTQPMAKYVRHEKELADERYENHAGRTMSTVDC